MFGYFAWNAGMILSCQIDRSSLRQLSMVRLTWAPPALAAGCEAAPPVDEAGVEFALVHAANSIASDAPIARNRRFKVGPPPPLCRPASLQRQPGRPILHMAGRRGS